MAINFQPVAKATKPDTPNFVSGAYADQQYNQQMDAIRSQNVTNGLGLIGDYNAHYDELGENPIADALRDMKNKMTQAPPSDLGTSDPMGSEVTVGGADMGEKVGGVYTPTAQYNSPGIQAQPHAVPGFGAPGLNEIEPDPIMERAQGTTSSAPVEMDIQPDIQPDAAALSSELRTPMLDTGTMAAVPEAGGEALAGAEALGEGGSMLGKLGKGAGYLGIANSLANGDIGGAAKGGAQSYLAGLGPYGWLASLALEIV